MKRQTWLLVGLVAIVLLLIGVGIGFASTRSPGWWGMMGAPYGPGMMGGYGYMGWAGWLMMLLFWALVIGVIIWVIQSAARTARHPDSGPRSAETPLDILKRRYASGEITKEQFDEMRRNLDV